VKRSKTGAWRVVVVVGFVIFLCLLVLAVVQGRKLLDDRSTSETTTADAAGSIKVTIKQGMSTTQVGQLLQRSGVIESTTVFVDLVKERGSENKLQPGTYTLPKDIKLELLVDQLEKGAGAELLKITIAEGLSAGQIAASLTEKGTVNGDEYMQLAGQPAKFTVPKIGDATVTVGTLEGLLFPSTYSLVEGSAETLIKEQLAAFATKTADLPWDNAKTLGVTPYQIVIIASMIEKEASVADERAKVAAVIYNRLQKNMPLQIDATVRFALSKWTGALTDSDLKTSSPYNTRVNKGLPPGPISNPGVAALTAALEPADVDYLYYVLADDKGNHFFTASYEEFLKAKEKAPQQ
jgi:UPF0755 protein